MDDPSLTIGIEEEYLVVDLETRDLVKSPPKEMWDALGEVLGHQVTYELLKAQIEVGTRICRRVKEARQDLARLRADLSGVVAGYGAAIIAASTHPFARWSEQETTEHERYLRVADDLQHVARQLVVCGMHIHVGIEDEHLRIDLMNQIRYMLPHLLALSTSSPFWEGVPTGLLAYRPVLLQNLPRTGLPEEFVSWGEYQRYLGILIDAGLIEDGTKLWWHLRPSARFPTLEMRITDVCTRLDDAMTVAALYQCLLSYMYRLRRDNQRWRSYPAGLINENVWRAQRYGVDGALVDFGKGRLVAMSDLVEEFVDLVKEDAASLDVVDEVENARNIVDGGTSAHRQLEAYRTAIESGATEEEALRDVVDVLVADTLSGITQGAQTPKG
ncbi:MAG: carboxylate-amine ligase [Actinobacteria bacterium]|nr:carboxylate-amine ligase [Actinomycetota bacterium]MCI0544996.1 carboxylate-amine ligase [Actinomycetota bacterium]MCI0678734.1 carboxylate-amine ligase [Actinomycetota bacterium]